MAAEVGLYSGALSQVVSTPDLDSVLTARNYFFARPTLAIKKIFFRRSQTNSHEKKTFRGGRFRNLATFFGDISDSALKCEYLEL